MNKTALKERKIPRSRPSSGNSREAKRVSRGVDAGAAPAGLRFITGAFVFLVVLCPAIHAGRMINLYCAKANLLVLHAHEDLMSLTPTIMADLADAQAYSLESSDDPAYLSAKKPSAAKRKSKLLNQGVANTNTYSTSFEYWITLTLPSPLESGKNYTVIISPDLAELFEKAEHEFTFDEHDLYSEAIHVNNVGYLTDASMKYGYVGQYLGDQGDISYAASTKFHIMDTKTREYVLSGTLAQRNGNAIYKTPIYQCDFSALKKDGSYKLVVEGVGCSYPFELSADAYRRAYQAVCRGLFHERCGCEIKPEHSLWWKPRCHHSDDYPAWQCSGGWKNDQVDNLIATKTSEKIESWGAWHDAGDHDHYPDHLKIPLHLYAAYELNPNGTGDGEFNIPESGNGIPDIIDEAKWGVDFYKRLQKADGRIPGYITYTPSASALDNTKEILASRPVGGDVPLQYSAMAAGMAYYLKKFDKPGAEEYIQSAKKSYNQGNSGVSKAAAAFWLWKATGDASFHNTFKSNCPQFTTNRNAPNNFLIACYVLMGGGDAATVNKLKTQIINQANKEIAGINADAMRMYRNNQWLGQHTQPSTVALPLAYRMTGEKKYRDYNALALDYSLGANLLNMTWITGLGENHPKHLTHVEYLVRWGKRGLNTPTGLTPFGPQNQSKDSDGFGWCSKLGESHKTAYPAASNWSDTEMWFEKPSLICNNEFTTRQTCGPNTYLYAGVTATKVSSNWPKPPSTEIEGAYQDRIRFAQGRAVAVSFCRNRMMIRISVPTRSRVSIFNAAGARVRDARIDERGSVSLAGLTPGLGLVVVQADAFEPQVYRCIIPAK